MKIIKQDNPNQVLQSKTVDLYKIPQSSEIADDLIFTKNLMEEPQEFLENSSDLTDKL